MHQETSSQVKQNRLSQSVPCNQPFKSKQPLSVNTDYATQLPSKSATKLPPLKVVRAQQLLNKTSESAHQNAGERKPIEADKKVGQPQSSYVVRKVIQKSKNEKKKPLQQSFKPQTILRYEQYQSFLSHINISNNVIVTNEQFEKPYVLYVGKGNNGILIKNIFRTYRPWWSLEDNDPSNSQINLHWYQLRQNNILERFKQVNTYDQQFDKIDYYCEEVEPDEKSQEPIQTKSRNQQRVGNQRSQSVVGKDFGISARKPELNLDKRSSSRTKTFNKSSDKIAKQSPSLKSHAFKELKQEALDSQANNTYKKALANPKMWPIFFMYRKIFSNPDMKKIKKMGVLKQDGRLKGKILRSKMRVIENRSNHIAMHNHLQNNWNLSNKKALFMNIRHYFEARKINPFEYIPITFHVEKIGDKQYDNFVEQYHRRCDQIVQDEKNNKKSQYKATFKPKKRNAWLVKPGENTNRGIGIEVVESLQQIKEILTKDNVDDQGRPRTHIIQEYIMPFLYQKRKFDIRCYILITSVNGIQKGYWYQDGYIRTACKQFTMKNLSNRMIHLTNDAVQKKCEDYGKFQPGNKLSFADFQRYLDNNFNNIQNGPKLKFWQQAYPDMKKLATDAIRCVYSKINPNKKEFSFEIFGLDFLIDDNFKVWLIEANTNPCLQLSSPLLGRIIPSMLENAFKIAVDPIFPPPPLPEIAKMIKKITVPQNCIQNNKFELVFDEVEQSTQLKGLITNGPDVQIYNIEQQEEEYLDDDKEECVNDQ